MAAWTSWWPTPAFWRPGAIDVISEQAWDRHFEVNVKGYFLAVREAARVMKLAGRGVILLNASKGAFAPTVDNAAYASSKAAVAALGRNLAAELGPHGIRVNALNADFIDTPLMRGLIEQRAAMSGITVEQQQAEYRRRNLLQVGPIPPEAVAEAALFLVSPRRPTRPARRCPSTAASRRRCRGKGRGPGRGRGRRHGRGHRLHPLVDQDPEPLFAGRGDVQPAVAVQVDHVVLPAERDVLALGRRWCGG